LTPHGPAWFLAGEKHVSRLLPFVFVGLGGAAGSLLRYGFTLMLQRWAVTMPYGTFVSNLVGCFIIGLVTETATRGGLISPSARLLLATGFCGGLTTMSSFIYESGKFAQESEWWLGFLYFGGTLLGCMAAYVIAIAMIRAFIPQ
jgi:CrcB protein